LGKFFQRGGGVFPATQHGRRRAGRGGGARTVPGLVRIHGRSPQSGSIPRNDLKRCARRPACVSALAEWSRVDSPHLPERYQEHEQEVGVESRAGGRRLDAGACDEGGHSPSKVRGAPTGAGRSEQERQGEQAGGAVLRRPDSAHRSGGLGLLPAAHVSYEFTTVRSARHSPPTSRSRWRASGCRTPRSICGSRTGRTRRRSGRSAWTGARTAASDGGIPRGDVRHVWAKDFWAKEGLSRCTAR